MTPKSDKSLHSRQHWVIARRQLLSFGYTSEWIRHAVAARRLFPIHAGVYAVGKRELTQEGHFVAAVLACGDHAVLSHDSAAVLWGILKALKRMIEISVPLERNPRVK